MGFTRWRRTDHKAAIKDFWSWWSNVHGQLTTELANHQETSLPRRVQRALQSRVQAIHPELSWELIDGVLARHALVLSPEGSPGLRVITERWRRAGPGDDENWEFYPARPPNPSAMRSALQLGRRTVSPLQARFAVEVDSARGRVHVTLSHSDLPYLEDAERLWFAFLLLDWVLGEDDVERWIGDVHFSDASLDLDGSGLRRAVTELSKEVRGAWAHLEGLDDSERRTTVEVRVPSPRLDYPLLDLHCTVRIPLVQTPAPPDDEIIALAVDPPAPDTTELLEIEALTKGLVTLLGDSAVLAAVETVPDLRTLHLYADQEGVVPAQLNAWVEGQRREITVSSEPDPGWKKIRHFT